MEPQVNYDQRYGSLVTVYRFGSFAAAAAEMKLTASAVAKQIHSLERDLDRPLFIRSGKRLLPTRVCEAHLKSAGIQLAMFKIMMELDSISTIKKLVESNYGVSVLPNKVCARDAEAGHFTIKPIADMNMARQIHMFYRPEFRGAELLGDVQKLYYEVMSE